MSEQSPQYKVQGKTEIRHGCRLPFSDQQYEPPTSEEVRQALKHGGLTGAAAGQLLGVGGRTVRKWTGGERDIPYSAWRLLLIHVGLALDDTHAMAADKVDMHDGYDPDDLEPEVE